MALIPPTVGVDDAPTVQANINATWIGYLLGALEATLLKESTWEGDEAALFDVIQQVEELTNILVNGN